jgi:hypothetical protein
VPQGAQSGGVSSAAIGAAAGGLAALAALVLLLLLFKKRKKVDEVVETVESEATLESTIDEDDVYISEYGLSDGVRPMDDDDDYGDLPRDVSPDGACDSETGNISEHNPEELDEGGLDLDE